MYRTKIYGAGSIGNHLGNAARCLGWSVDICDTDAAALARTKQEIYPARYGSWDDQIGLYLIDDAPIGEYDLIMIGTPPDSHVRLALSALEENPKGILVEKPFCGPGLEQAQEFFERARDQGTKVFVGYDHVIGQATSEVSDLIASNKFGEAMTLDVEFREYWGGIFKAHPWLDGPSDSYLGYWERGGGAAGEHSHAINLWQHIAHTVSAGQVTEVSARIEYVTEGGAYYDRLAALNLKTENGLVGRVIQDVVTSPPRKWGRLQGSEGYVEWDFGLKPGYDSVRWQENDVEIKGAEFEKSRPDDFITELSHIEDVISGKEKASPISLERGLDTALVIAAAHLSAQQNRFISINYNRGYHPTALEII
jgi:predicted dehydrogenase